MNSKETWENYIIYLKQKYNNIVFDNIPSEHETNYCAVIVEMRKHPHLEYIIKNTVFNLPTFSLQIFCGNNNKEYIENIIKNWKNVTLINIKKDNLTKNEYSDLLKSQWFYNNINFENILIFQSDVIILKNNIDQFIKYDYIGAPWKNTGTTFGNIVGNGGLSFRKKTKMLYIIENVKKKNQTAEDVFFSQYCNKFGFNIANLNSAKQFSSETIYYKNPFGLHKTYYFLDNKLIKNLLTTEEKYIYCPFREGMGLNNRRQVLEFCIMLAYTLNRTLMLNKIYSKSIHNDVSVNIETIWNISKLKQFINIKLIDKVSIDKNEINYISNPYKNKLKFSEYRNNNTIDKKYILLDNMFTWIYFSTCIDLTDKFTYNVLKLKNKYFTFSDNIILNSELIKKKINSEYISIHFRLGDMLFKPIHTSYSRDYYKIIGNDIYSIMNNINPSMPILICTNKKENNLIKSFCKKYDTVFISDFIKTELTEVEICCIEMLLCLESKIHIPSLKSSWDDYIMLKRYDNLDLLKLWISMLQKHLNTENKINAKLFFEINK